LRLLAADGADGADANPAALSIRRSVTRRWRPRPSRRHSTSTPGRLIFSKHCGNCHRLFGEGSDHGPDLTGLQRSNLDYLLAATIDPSAVIGNDYQAIVVLTTKGETITGLVKHEDREFLRIQTVSEPVIVPKEEIRQRSASEASFMPEGLLQALSDDEVRDLIGYLQGDDQAPLAPEQGD
jgi:putative heme-binding domain-containing protein